jgi:hypothetical protein
VLKQSLAFKFGRKFSETETEWDFEKLTGDALSWIFLVRGSQAQIVASFV